jgi:hypothetical protein
MESKPVREGMLVEVASSRLTNHGVKKNYIHSACIKKKGVRI